MADHHYVPQGYLKRWLSGNDIRLTRFQHNYKEVVPLRVATAATGYEKDLYTSKLNPQLSDRLEREFMQVVDSDASKLIDLFTDPSGTLPPLNKSQLDGWTRFLMSLMHRSPARVADLKRRFAEVLANTPIAITDDLRADYNARRGEGDPPTLEEYIARRQPQDAELGGLMTIANVSNSEKIGTTINKMIKHVVHLKTSKHELLASDRPLIQEGGLDNPMAFLMLAIGPRHLFIATNTQHRMAQILANVASNEVTRFNNVSICQQAERFVYGTNASQLNLVRKFFHRPVAETDDQ